MGAFWIEAIVGFVVGVPVALFFLSLLFAARRGDGHNEQLEWHLAEKNGKAYHG